MIFCLSENVFDEKHSALDISIIIRNSYTRSHTILITNSAGELELCQNNKKFSDWLKNNFSGAASDIIHLLIEACSIISPTNTAFGSKYINIANNSPPKILSITTTEAVLASAQPLYIMVENKINDAAFFRRIMPKIWRERFIRMESEGLIKFEQGGGISEIHKIIEFHSDETICKKIFGLGTKLWAELHFIIYDHDGESPSTPSTQSKSIETACAKINCKNHRLKRKKQENYLPLEAMTDIVNKNVLIPDKTKMLSEINNYFLSAHRSHMEMPNVVSTDPNKKYNKVFKNKFNFVISFGAENNGWNDTWFETDGSSEEMILLAEKISTCV